VAHPNDPGEKAMPHNSLLLPQAIRQVRKERAWTQIDLANRLNVSQSTISFWERGVETPSLEHQVALVTLMPEIFEKLAKQQTDLLARLYQLERAVYGGKCHCKGCSCSG
jgi:DNA-binding XRE family transcriptional regulator